MQLAMGTTENQEKRGQIDRRTTDTSITLYYTVEPFRAICAILLDGFPWTGDPCIFLFLGGYIDKRKQRAADRRRKSNETKGDSDGRKSERAR